MPSLASSELPKEPGGVLECENCPRHYIENFVFWVYCLGFLFWSRRGMGALFLSAAAGFYLPHTGSCFRQPGELSTCS